MVYVSSVRGRKIGRGNRCIAVSWRLRTVNRSHIHILCARCVCTQCVSVRFELPLCYGARPVSDPCGKAFQGHLAGWPTQISSDAGVVRVTLCMGRKDDRLDCVPKFDAPAWRSPQASHAGVDAPDLEPGYFCRQILHGDVMAL